MDIVITTNSPGEVAAWLSPLVGELRKLTSTATITVFIPPCTFASGAEERVVARMPGVDLAVGPKGYLKYIATGRRPKGFSPGRTGVVVFLGGDLTHAVLLKRKLGYPAIAYNEGFVNWPDAFEALYLPDEACRERAVSKGFPRERAFVIGDLMLDAIWSLPDPEIAAHGLGVSPGRISNGEPVISIFPGSRRAQLKVTPGLFLRSADLIRRQHPHAQFLLSVSDFVSPRDFVAAFRSQTTKMERIEIPDSMAGQYSGSGHGEIRVWNLVTGGGTEIRACQGMQYDIMRMSDLALTLPGSNTAEMAFLGVPMVVAVPLDRPEEIPLEGIAGIIGSVPLLGRAIKRSAIRKYLAKTAFTALPNRKAQARIVPELVGKVKAEDVAIAAVDLLNQPARLEKMGEQLRSISGSPGAAARLASAVLDVARSADDERDDSI